MKPGVLHLAKSAPMIAVMRGLKQMLDPRGILNPGKVLPPHAQEGDGTRRPPATPRSRSR